MAVSGCLGGGDRFGGIIGRDTGTPKEGRHPEPGDLEVDVIPAEEDKDQHVHLRSVTDDRLWMNGSVLVFPDGFEYVFGDRADIILGMGYEVEVYVDDRDDLRLHRAALIYVLGADHPDPPALTRDADVSIISPSSEVVYGE
ncbi:hypothetical protein GCM10025298_15650 [Natronobiforma cellulositropha]